MRLGQTSAIFFVSKLLGSLFGFVATVIFARLFGEAVLGQYALVLALVTWLSLIGKVGLSESITKRLSEGEDVDEFMGAGLVIMASIGGLVSIAVLVFRDWINAYVGAPVSIFVVVLVLCSLLNSYGNSALQGRHLVHVSSVLSTGAQLLRTVVQIALLSVGFGLQAMIAGYALGRFVPGILSFRYVETRPKLPSRQHFVSLIDYAKFSWLGNVQSKVFNTLDVLLLGVFVSQGFVGIYSAAWSVGMVLDIFGNGIRATLFPEMSKVATEDEAGAVAGLTEDALRFTGLLMIPGLVGGLVVGDRLLRFYGEGFGIGTEVLGILLLALLVYSYTKQLLNTLNAIDRPDLAFRTNAAFIGSNVVLNLILISEYAWVGAAMATLLSVVVGITVAFRYVSGQIDVSLPVLEIGRQLFAASLMGAVVYGGRSLSEATWLARYNEVYVFCLVSIGAAVYFVTLFGISNRFRSTVLENVPSNRFA
jgi:O-antigen/teichoic acid export membrane protein